MKILLHSRILFGSFIFLALFLNFKQANGNEKNALVFDRANLSVTALLKLVPELSSYELSSGEEIHLEPQSMPFKWLVNQIAQQECNGIQIQWQVAEEGFLSTCKPSSSGLSIITINRKLLCSQYRTSLNDRFEISWMLILHELENTKKRRQFLSIFKYMSDGKLKGDSYVRQSIALEIDSIKNAVHNHELLIGWSALGVNFNFVLCLYDKLMHMDRESCISYYLNSPIGDYYRLQYQNLSKGRSSGHSSVFDKP